MDEETGPIRCDSSLSVVKIQPVGVEQVDKVEKQRLLTRHKFSDPEIEELYQLHSANQKRTELFRCFLYCILFYSVVHIIVYGAWIGRHPVLFGGSYQDDPSHSLEDLHHDRYGGHGGGHPTSSGDGNHGNGMVTTSADLNVETPETMTLNTYASMLEGTHNRLLKSVFHVDDTSDVLQYSALASPAAGTTATNIKRWEKISTSSGSMSSTTQKYFSTSTSSHRFNGDRESNAQNIIMQPPSTEKRHKIDEISQETDYMDDDDDDDSVESPELIEQKPLEAPPQPLPPQGIKPPPSEPKFYHRLQYKKEISRTSAKFWRPPTYRSFNERRRTLERNKRSIVTRGLRRVIGGGHQVFIQTTHNQKHLNDLMAQPYTRRLGASEFVDEDHHYPPEPGNLYFVICLMCLLIACVFIVTLMLLPFRSCPKNHHIPVIIWSATILCSVACNVESSVHPRLALGWILLETFLIWITIPLRMRTALFYTTLVALVYIVIISVRERARLYLGRQIAADIILIVITNILGMLEFYLSDKKQRRAFIDTRQSLEMKLVIQEQANEQERLLLSVLPEHLALKMRQDLGAATDGQFKKIYMSRHENVSILYADIVGFTAISSTYSASELVKILNELFATFDKLAEKYNQIRIKILGDCYYCICGAPEERADHAILCVHMGLSMVKAIKYVREKTKSSVDMRVGIHTGAILAGVLGQRQWQFDIYSEDVVLANKMESSGKPGRVHISEVTLGFLDGGFEVEPAHGEKREEILRIAGIKTYFIVRTIKPLRESSTGITENGDLPDDTTITKDFPSDLNSTFAEDSNSAIEESNVLGKQTELEAYRLRLKEELLSRDGYKDLSSQSHWLTLGFRDSVKETEFNKHKDPYAGIYYGACPCALVAVALSAFSVVSFTVIGLVVLLVGLVFLGMITTFSACETSPMKSRLKKMSGMMESICSLESELWVRRLVSVLGALVLTAANIAFMIPCLETKECAPTNPLRDGEVEEPMVLPNRGLPGQHDDCRLPVFFIPFAAVILFGITLLNYLGFWLKSLIIITILLLHATFMLATPLKTEMECSERLIFNDEHRLIPVYCYLTLFAGVAFAGLFSLNRRLEKSARVLFLWKTEVEHQRETATQLRQKNEALVYNILPPHVATHFLGNRRRKHEELYSQSYSEVGILFASMPNFSDFYTEETVNNQGLECLRFLNEVISDYDALLELPKFNEHIIKIKTIASTYMAASGLTPSKQARPEDPVKTRWHHLSLLVEFAFELKRALTSINEQSFNHFVLKMGINHGPITAGVIGARKPHYDIWGNSVNVASRMESTGKAGCIQVTAETHRILRLYGYTFEQRGLVNVKGKGMLMTYYLIGRGPDPSELEVQKMLSEPTDTPTDGTTNAPLLLNQSNANNHNSNYNSSSSTTMTTTVTTTRP